MKTKLHSPFAIRHSSFSTLLAALALCLTALPARAQDTVTISAAEFQRMVYSAHLHTQLAEKPELDACLQVLLELHRRNPNANPVALADLSRQALLRYRTTGPASIRTSGVRDEILAAYMDALREVPAHTNFIPAHLSLLQTLTTRGPTPKDEPQADLIHSGSQFLLSAENDAASRQALLDACARRAHANGAFATALDALLLPETPVSVRDAPAAILGNTNSALHGNLTMQTLLALSADSGNGSLTVSSNQLMTLFAAETQTLRGTIHTNLALLAEFNQAQPDLLSYLTNQPARADWETRVAAVQQGQPRTIASATAAILVQSQLVAAPDPLIKLPGQMSGVASGLHQITDGLAAFAGAGSSKLTKIAASGNILSGALGIFDLFFGGESPEDEISREIGNVKTLIGDLSTNMNYRFDRVDQSLTTIFNTLNERFDQIHIEILGQSRQIARLNGNVDQIRLSLLDVQTQLSRLERNLATFHALDWRFDLLEQMNLGLSYEDRVGNPMQYQDFLPSYVSLENTFYTHAYNRAASETLSRYTTLPFGPEHFYSQLSPGGATNVYAETLNYLKKALRQTLSLPDFPEAPLLANPQDWSVGAGAWLQLSLENPGLYRRYLGALGRLDGLINRGRELTNFFRSLTFTGPNINWPLHNTLGNYYVQKLTNFTSQLAATEQQYASDSGFALNTWRAWSASAPRVTAAATEVAGIGRLSSGLPAGLSNVLAIAASRWGGLQDWAPFHDGLALKADGTVVAWGLNNYGQTDVPAGLSNVVAIAAGGYFALALKADGTVIGWGYNYRGQATGTPNLDPPYVSSATVTVSGQPLTGVVAIAAGEKFGLALKADGTIAGWGTDAPPTSGLSNVVAIAAGDYWGLALRADGTVAGLGADSAGATSVPANLRNVVAIAAGGSRIGNFALALKADGTVVGWGYNDGSVPPDLSDVAAIAGGYFGSLALKSDGTVVGWGNNGGDVPAGLSNVVAIAGGWQGGLFLTITNAAGSDGSDALSFIRAQLPRRIGSLIRPVNANSLAELGRVGSLNSSAIELSGARALLTAVLELALPYTLDRDEVLRGFLHGSESLVDLEAARAFLEAENAKLPAWPDLVPQGLADAAELRYQRFAERLTARLNDLQLTGQPEIPRLVGHTLRQLNLLRDAWTPVPPPSLELWREGQTNRLVLYGEPYLHYSLQTSASLSAPGWTTTTTTNWHNEQIIVPPVSGSPQRFYRGLLPVP